MTIHPCPECGSTRVHIRREAVDRMQQVECQACRMRGPAKAGEHAAIEAWNHLTRKDNP
jgi:Lar family restriction alleviation protein